MIDLHRQLQVIQNLLDCHDYYRAEEACVIVAAKNPECCEVWRLLGQAANASGKVMEAISAYRRAVELQPRDATILNDLGICLAQQGELTEAIVVFQAALRHSPQFAQVHHNLGVALAQLNRAEEAEYRFRLAVELEPQYAQAFVSLGNLLVSNSKLEDAIKSFQQAIRFLPNSAEALNGLGLSLVNAKRTQEAIIVLAQATRLKPDFEGAFNNIGLALGEEGRYLEAEKAFEATLRINPRSVDAHSNLGNLFKEQGKLAAAVMCYDLALALSPNCVSARWNRSLALLQNGDFKTGWVEYESRWSRAATSFRRRMSQPEWDGTSLVGRAIFVHCEQGLGDAIQFVRYTALLKRLGGFVIVEAPLPLLGVFATCRSIDQLICEGDLVPPFDVHAPMMSLPRLLGTELESIPTEIPYLTPKPEDADHWKDVLKQYEGLKIGIAWQGNPHHQWDRHRSVELRRFAQLAQVHGISLISLQRGPGTDQLRLAPFAVAEVLDPNESDSRSLEITAAIMLALDLIITVDTATAHLAGALGAKTWLLLSTLVDWRWLLVREDSPWYPTMRLFRQRIRDDWSTPLHEIAQEVKTLAAV